jgi:hypothetical protein
MPTLTIIRGLPGSGKSTLAREAYFGTPHFEADMWHEINGEYIFTMDEVGRGHQWCIMQVEATLRRGDDCVVSNTFTTLKEMAPYVDLIHKYELGWEIVECTDSFGSVHDIPEEKLDQMRDRWWLWPWDITENPVSLLLPIVRCPMCTEMATAAAQRVYSDGSTPFRCSKKWTHKFQLGWE